MGGIWSSTTIDPNSSSSSSTTPTDSPTPNASNPNMSSPSDSTTPENQAPKDALNPQRVTETLEEEKRQEDVGESEILEEEEGECGFCLFMKAGGCRESFIAWEECVKQCEEKKEDLVEKCFEVTATLKTCMKAHPDYYHPILKAEEAAEDEVVKEIEKEKASKSSEQDSTSENADQQGDSSDKRDG